MPFTTAPSSVTRVPQSTDVELRAAVESAKKVSPAWRATSFMAGQQIMFKFTHLVQENWNRLAASINLEQGKTFAEHGLVGRALWMLAIMARGICIASTFVKEGGGHEIRLKEMIGWKKRRSWLIED
ncbi:hypothetical protein BJ878DRAFT_483686 [Calycina marina]|uniref:Aldehyde dehydrogenase domain-containing protein n=1 Tax=Calycina marina TaxID=1763456 RepID=A0A9P8CB52_9HELO|nr:hypothetical protein BJ878DRAFT_483686 [Calycina marina]